LVSEAIDWVRFPSSKHEWDARRPVSLDPPLRGGRMAVLPARIRQQRQAAVPQPGRRLVQHGI